MSTITKDSLCFQFMLKEYEKLYSHFDMHYSAVDKTINFYFVLIGAIISITSFSGKIIIQTGIFELSEIQLLFLFVLAIIGTVIYLKVIEHRLLVIAYVKSLNLNRKWFEKHSEDLAINDFLYFKTGVESPPFYKRFRHFYWEAIALGFINSLLLALFLINIEKKIIIILSKDAIVYNCLFLASISVILTSLHLYYYKKRGMTEDKALRKRFNY